MNELPKDDKSDDKFESVLKPLLEQYMRTGKPFVVSMNADGKHEVMDRETFLALMAEMRVADGKGRPKQKGLNNA